MHRRLVILLLAGVHLSFVAAASSWNEELFRAVQEADLAGVQAALAAGADVNFRRDTHFPYSDVPERGFTPLMVAASDATPEVVGALLDAGASLHLRGTEYGVLINPTSGPEFVEYRNALLLAAEHNPDPEVSRLLLKAGAFPDSMTTVMTGRVSGPDSPQFPYPVARTHTFSPIGLALERNPNPEVALVLQEYARTLRYPDIGWHDYLLFAASHGGDLLVNDLLDAGVKIDSSYERLDLPREPVHTVTGLHAAVEAGNFETARLLLEAGADPNALADEHGYTPLVSAVLQNQAGMVELLLEAGANPQAGRNALLEALVSEPGEVIIDMLSAATEVGPADAAAADNLIEAVRNEETGRVLGLFKLYEFPELVLTRALQSSLTPVIYDQWDFESRRIMARELIAAGATATVAPPDGPPPAQPDPAYSQRGSAVTRLYPELYIAYYPRYSGFESAYPYWQRMELTLLLLDAGLQMPERVLTLLQTEAESDERLSELLQEHGFASDF